MPDQAAMRIVAIHHAGMADQFNIIGLGCVVGLNRILTSQQVVEDALPIRGPVREGQEVLITLVGLPDHAPLQARVMRLEAGETLDDALALLESVEPLPAQLRSNTEFATALRSTGKEFSVMGFTDRKEGGTTVTGRLEAANNSGLLSLIGDGIGQLGYFFGGSPVWSPELNAFVGLVSGKNFRFCIPSPLLCRFCPELPVRFRIPKSDRPQIEKLSVDDPNVGLFGLASERNGRELTATLERNENNTYRVTMRYNIDEKAAPARGHYVTFITYPNMGSEYELIEEIGNERKVEAICNPLIADFTIAAIGDGGDTRLTLNLKEVLKQSKAEENVASKRPRQANPMRKTEGKTEAGSMEKAAEATESAIIGFRPTYALYTNDQAPYANRRQPGELTDALRNRDYARQMAQLICAKLTPMPFSLGLFGDWGSGKSYFIGLLHHEIEEITKQEEKVFHRKVVQIHFNAWHYLDTSLWANLVCEIFDNLFKELIAREDTPNEKVEKLKKKLTDESALAAEAKKALEDAKRARTEAEAKLKEASEKRENQERTVATFLDDVQRVIANVTTQPTIKQDLTKLSNGFGLTRLNESFSELEGRALEARSLGGRCRSLGLTLLSPEGLWQRLGLLLVALIAPALLAWGLPWLMESLKVEMSALARSVTTVVTLVGTVATWISAQTKRGADLLKTLETTYENVKQAREEKRKAEGPPPEQVALDKTIKEETEAQYALNEAQTKVRAIESELRELAPGRRLLKFLEQRAGANDYRQHLGLVSLVRRDFEKLSELLNDGNEPKAGDPSEPPVLNRIVLYIDDLDRCKSDRVIAVLEAVHLLLAFPIFAVVVAVDPRWLRKSLVEHYPTLLLGGKNKEGEVIIESRESLASPQDYLEKIFQVPFQLEPIEKEGFTKLVADLLPIEKKRVTDQKKKPEANIGVSPRGTAVDFIPTTGNVVAPTHTEATEGATSTGPTAQRIEGRLEETAPTSAPVGPSETEKEKTTEPQKLSPERLELTEWERAAVQLCYPLFRTPRAVKRLANTYCLIRTGVEAGPDDEIWKRFIGSATSPLAGYRMPLLMLAVAAAYPGLARDWFDELLNEAGWISAAEAQASLNKNPDWAKLAGALNAMKANDFAPFDQAQVQHWLPKVKRYSF